MLKSLYFQLVMEFCGAGSVTDLVKGKENLNTVEAMNVMVNDIDKQYSIF